MGGVVTHRIVHAQLINITRKIKMVEETKRTPVLDDLLTSPLPANLTTMTHNDSKVLEADERCVERDWQSNLSLLLPEVVCTGKCIDSTPRWICDRWASRTFVFGSLPRAATTVTRHCDSSL